jgi:hypothetical protein
MQKLSVGAAGKGTEASQVKCKIKLSAIEMDTSIQCRASIITETVTDYAERMTEGDSFPPVILFGDSKRCWIGDGWHRIMAAKQIGALDIDADLEPGDRVQALQHALGANAANGLHRTNADKRRCVTIALAEFPDLSSRAIAEMCGVSNHMVDDARPQLGDYPSSKRIGLDGKQRPATQRPQIKTPQQEEAVYAERAKEEAAKPQTANKNTKPCDGLQFARMAILDLKQIKKNDTEREDAFNLVKEWINENE